MAFTPIDFIANQALAIRNGTSVSARVISYPGNPNGATITPTPAVGTLAIDSTSGNVYQFISGTAWALHVQAAPTATGILAVASGVVSARSLVAADIPVINPSSLPTVSQGSSGSFLKFTVDSFGRVTANTAVVVGDLTTLLSGATLTGTLALANVANALNVTYSQATGSAVAITVSAAGNGIALTPSATGSTGMTINSAAGAGVALNIVTTNSIGLQLATSGSSPAMSVTASPTGGGGPGIQVYAGTLSAAALQITSTTVAPGLVINASSTGYALQITGLLTATGTGGTGGARLAVSGALNIPQAAPGTPTNGDIWIAP